MLEDFKKDEVQGCSEEDSDFVSDPDDEFAEPNPPPPTRRRGRDPKPKSKGRKRKLNDSDGYTT